MIPLINAILVVISLVFISIYLIPKTRSLILKNSELFSFFGALIGTFIGVSFGLSLGNQNQKQLNQSKYEIVLNQCIADLTGNHNSLNNIYANALAIYTAKLSVNDTSAKFNESRPNIFPSPVSIQLLLNNTELFEKLSPSALQYTSSTYFNIQNINNDLINVKSIDKIYIELLRNNLNQIAVLIQIIRIEKDRFWQAENEVVIRDKMEEVIKTLSSHNSENDLRIFLNSDFKPTRYETRDVTDD